MYVHRRRSVTLSISLTGVDVTKGEGVIKRSIAKKASARVEDSVKNKVMESKTETKAGLPSPRKLIVLMQPADASLGCFECIVG